MKFQWNEWVFQLMRPPGDGIPTYSAGKGAAASLQTLLYQSIFPQFSLNEVNSVWKETWKWLPEAQSVLIGVPLDTGAGIRRGAAYGPRGVRSELFILPEFQKLLKQRKVVDLGDIYVNPHLLHDSMLSDLQKKRCQDEMYPLAPLALRDQLPVSALSQLKRVLEVLTEVYPHLHIQVIGGDHSVAWPVSEVLAKKYPKTLGIVQSDAHTDLLSSRLGVQYCFGTWSFHANQLLGAGGRMVQIGIRQSGKDRKHWESTTGVKQYWAEEVRKRPSEEVIAEVIQHLKSIGMRQIYFSNDIDGTDENEASATGTPAPAGLSSDFLFSLIEKMGSEFELVASDVMEVAPDLGPDEGSARRTCQLSARYLMACLRAITKGSDGSS